MEKFVINGGKKLFGEVEIDLSKNSFLPILAGCLLCEEEIVLKNCPNYADINSMLVVLKKLGANVEKIDKDLYINCKNLEFCYIPNELTKTIRSSIFLLVR